MFRVFWIALLVLLPLTSQAEGLRVGTSLAALRYADEQGRPVNVYFASLGTRVSRGRAGLAFNVPVMGITGGRVALSDENLVVTSGEAGTRFGLSDMSVGLDYNLVQNRERMFIVTLGGNLRFPTAAPGLGMGEHLFGLSLSAVYGLTRQLLAYAEARHSWVGVLTPVSARTKSGELGAIWWFTDKLGVSASMTAADYGGRAPASLEFNLGLTLALLPGMSMNLGGIGGLFGGAPQAGGTFGFGFEL